MGKKTALILAVVAAVLSCAVYSNAAVLGTIDYSGAGRGHSEFSDMKFSISYPLPGDRDSISLSWNVTTDDVGETFFASAETHDNFDVFTYLLTNGTDNGLFLSDNCSLFGFNPLSGLPEPIEYESTIIAGLQGGVDFEGYTVNSIGLTVNELVLNSYVAYRFAYTDFNYDITYTINGQTLAIPGDFDGDGDVDNIDFGIWQANSPTASGATLGMGDADGDGDVDGVDFGIWQSNYSTNSEAAALATTPEPATLLVLALGLAGLLLHKKRRA